MTLNGEADGPIVWFTVSVVIFLVYLCCDFDWVHSTYTYLVSIRTDKVGPMMFNRHLETGLCLLGVLGLWLMVDATSCHQWIF